ncbi:uncharacterized protein LOC133894821 [Phragmites australis]|uniref:uncharacterized protein LOC133894821 n=1 Tax=Phragmites australis TaxID=29695 RepID=UPI002D79077F|nr:uncharacterized protein LOC133894821 [Phragmites australis]XP_062190986.1 uncharacterized protein LOC133894821 [Phragmites australis]
MDVFNGVRFVRLRCCARRGNYLAAGVDGQDVCLSSQRGLHNAVWAVQHAAGPDGGPCVLFRGAYGRYLLATDLQADTGPSHGVAAAQDDLSYNPPPPGMLWQAIRRRSTFVIRSSTGRYLRANGRYLRWRRAITVAGDNGSTMMQWAIENVPIRMTRPCILDPTYQLTHPRRPPPTESEVARQIRYVRGDANGNINEGAWRMMQLYTNNLMQLRLTLACCMGASRDVTRTTLCIRAGRYGQLSPLLIDLPIGNNRIDIVVLTHGTQADDDLRYPDLNAPRVEDSSKDS